MHFYQSKLPGFDFSTYLGEWTLIEGSVMFDVFNVSDVWEGMGDVIKDDFVLFKYSFEATLLKLVLFSLKTSLKIEEPDAITSKSKQIILFD